MKSLLAALCLLVLAGCASPGKTIWERSDHAPTKPEYDRDTAACNYDAKRVFNQNISSPLMARYLGEQTYSACMESKGWIPRKI